MKIAYFSPLSPLKSGIVDYSEKELLPFLKKYCDIDIYIDSGYKPTNKDIMSSFSIYNYNKFPNNADKYDTILYHVGNSKFHMYIYDTLQKYPGMVILHDTFIHGLIWNKTIGKGDNKSYIRELSQIYGKPGIKIAEYGINSQNFTEIEFKCPLIRKVVQCSKGVIVHSNYGKNIVMEEWPDVVVKKISHPLALSMENTNLNKIRKELGLNENTLIIGSFGFISMHKRMSVVLRAYKRFREEFPDSVLLVVGEDYIGLKSIINENNIKSVIQLGFVQFQKMNEYMHVSDICINLRYPTAGETSGNVLRLMSMGKPTIVSNVGWFAELPDSCCAKVDINDHEEEMILQYMKMFASNRDLIVEMGGNAAEYILKECDPGKVANEYYMFINDIIGEQRYVIKEISNDMADIGIGETDDFIIREIATVLKEFGIANI